MSWNSPFDYPKAMLHIDGDAFFAACEVAKNPKLRGKPVVTGAERGIVSAATYEAKRLGIMRGVPLSDVRKICPEAIILPSDYETYSLYSERMYEIVRRYTPDVEEYGIDECFADITGLRRMHHKSYEDIGKSIQADLTRELDITFSIGLGPTKVISKLGSKWQKPAGFTAIPLYDAPKFLKASPLRKIWGIGHNTASYLEKYGLRNAYDFAQKSEAWVREMVSKPYVDIWKELNGEAVLPLITDAKETYKSISKTKTFTPPSTNETFIFSQLSKNVENACIKARRHRLAPKGFSFFLKTQEFRYHNREVVLHHPTNAPQEILAALIPHFNHIYRRRTEYRATGITLFGLQDAHQVQLDLWSESNTTSALEEVYEKVDALEEKYGKHTIFLGTSLRALREPGHYGARGVKTERAHHLLKGERARKRLNVPYLGEVS